MKRQLSAILAVLLLLGCSAAKSPTDNPGKADAAEVQDSTAPIQCGTENRQHGTGYQAAMRECLWQAYTAGREAEFTTTVLTVEGDPIIRIVKILSPDRIQLTLDTTQDKFSSQEDRKVTTYTCTGLERELVTRQEQKRIEFRLTGCTGGQFQEIRL